MLQHCERNSARTDTVWGGGAKHAEKTTTHVTEETSTTCGSHPIQDKENDRFDVTSKQSLYSPSILHFSSTKRSYAAVL
jgi:hypothetical protein